MHIKDMSHIFDVHLLLLLPSTILLFVYVTVCLPPLMFHVSPISFPPSHFLHLWLPRQRGHGSQEAVTIFTKTQSHRCHARWLVFSPSLFFFYTLFLALRSLSILSISLSNLWDQPSKTDSEFFTDHECVSSYVTEAEIKREKIGEQGNMELICQSFLHLSQILAGSLTWQILS